MARTGDSCLLSHTNTYNSVSLFLCLSPSLEQVARTKKDRDRDSDSDRDRESEKYEARKRRESPRVLSCGRFWISRRSWLASLKERRNLSGSSSPSPSSPIPSHRIKHIRIKSASDQLNQPCCVALSGPRFAVGKAEPPVARHREAPGAQGI